MRANLLSIIAIAGLLSGCLSSSEHELHGEVQEIQDVSVHPKIIGGIRDEERARDNVLAIRIGKGESYGLCSGSLITPNLVLTALHCVAKGVTSRVSCDSLGKSHNGDHVGDTHDPDQLSVYLGTAPNFSGEPRSRAKYVIAPTSKVLCNTDIALIVLEKSIVDVTPLPVRLSNATKAQEVIKSIGYGVNDHDEKVGVRYVKDGVVILASGPGLSEHGTPLASQEFEVGKVICHGDSGGPAISESTGAIVGVVSRGGDCSDDFGHIYTATAGFDSLFEKAFKLAKTSAIEEAKNPSDISVEGSGCDCRCARSTSCSGGGIAALLVILGFAVVRLRKR